MLAIRPVTEADVPAVVAAQVAGWRAAYAGIVPDDYLRDISPPAWVARHLDRLRARPPREAYLLAEVNGRTAGFVRAGECRDGDHGPATGEVWAIYVDPAHWDTGVGHALLDAALDALRRAGFTAATLWVLEANDRARRFYARNGFTPDGHRRTVDLGAALPEVRYARAL